MARWSILRAHSFLKVSTGGLKDYLATFSLQLGIELHRFVQIFGGEMVHQIQIFPLKGQLIRRKSQLAQRPGFTSLG